MKKGITDQNKLLTRKMKVKRTIIVLLAIAIFELIFIFYSHRMSGLFSMLSLLAIMVLSLLILMNWFNLKFNNGNQKTISFLKGLMFLVPIIVLTVNFKQKYIEYNINLNREFAKGVIVKVYSEHTRVKRNEKTTYYADVNFFKENKWFLKQITVNSSNQYNVGDTITIEYSSTDPELYYILAQ